MCPCNSALTLLTAFFLNHHVTFLFRIIMARRTEPDALGVSQPIYNRGPACLWGPPLPLPCPACFSTVLPASTAPAPLRHSTLPQQELVFVLPGPSVCTEHSSPPGEFLLIPAPLKCHALCKVTAECPGLWQVGMNDSFSGIQHTLRVSRPWEL